MQGKLESLCLTGSYYTDNNGTKAESTKYRCKFSLACSLNSVTVINFIVLPLCQRVSMRMPWRPLRASCPLRDIEERSQEARASALNRLSTHLQPIICAFEGVSNMSCNVS